MTTLWVFTVAGQLASLECPGCHRARLPLGTGPTTCPHCRARWLLVLNPAAQNDRARIDRVEILPASSSVIT